MADEADLASEREEWHRAAALAAPCHPRPAVESPVFCMSCGERIPDARRASIPGTNVCGLCARQLTPHR